MQWDQTVQWLEQVEGEEADKVLSSRQIKRILQTWRKKHADLNPGKARVYVRNQERSMGAKAYNPIVTDDTMEQWLAIKALTDGACYFTLCDEGEGYPVQSIKLFRQKKQYGLLFGLADFEIDDDESE